MNCAKAQNRYNNCLDKTQNITDVQLDRINRDLEKLFVAEPMKH